jgi:hypothetical protein
VFIYFYIYFIYIFNHGRAKSPSSEKPEEIRKQIKAALLVRASPPRPLARGHWEFTPKEAAHIKWRKHTGTTAVLSGAVVVGSATSP